MPETRDENDRKSGGAAQGTIDFVARDGEGGAVAALLSRERARTNLLYCMGEPGGDFNPTF